MGSQVIALCSCGVHQRIRIGGGMRSFQYIQYFPFACSICKNIVEGNLLSISAICPDCGAELNGTVPEGVNAPVQYGNNIKALAVLLNVHYKLPFKKI